MRKIYRRPPRGERRLETKAFAKFAKLSFRDAWEQSGAARVKFHKSPRVRGCSWDKGEIGKQEAARRKGRMR